MQTRTVTLPDGHIDTETLFITPYGEVWAITKCMLYSLPKIGDVFEFDYTYRNEKTEIVKLIVVDVTNTHVWYKMPSISINKIFPITHEYWCLNQDNRRTVAHPTQRED